MSFGPGLFVYGSLRSDAPRPRASSRSAFALLAASGVCCGPATLPGRLLAPAWFPGWVPAPQGRVRGELWRLSDAAVLARLDRYEGRLYVRELCQARRADGRRATAWVYRYAGPVGGVPVIRSGDYVRWMEAAGATA